MHFKNHDQCCISVTSWKELKHMAGVVTLKQVCPTFWAASTEFGLHACSMKLNKENEE
jgi:hypothetical protein